MSTPDERTLGSLTAEDFNKMVTYTAHNGRKVSGKLWQVQHRHNGPRPSVTTAWLRKRVTYPESPETPCEVSE